LSQKERLWRQSNAQGNPFLWGLAAVFADFWAVELGKAEGSGPA
jgi:hypothetical protein